MTDTMTMTLVILIKTFDMKRYLLAIFVTILALASCSKDLDRDPIDNNNTIEEATTVLTFTSERPQLDVSTKTAWDADFHGIVWSTGDKIRIGFTFDGNWWSQTAAYDGTGHKKFYPSNDVVIDSENHNIGTFTVPMGANAFTGPTTSGDFVFYAVYPASLVENNQDDAPNVPVSLKSLQIPQADSYDPATDILVGKSKTITSTGLPSEHINLYWTRIVAHGNFTLKNFHGVEDGETISKVEFTAQSEANLTGEQVISVEDGTFTGNVTSNVVKLDGTNLSFVKEDGNTNLNVWLSVMPVTLTSLEVVVETDKATYRRSFTGIEKTLEGNRRNTMGINMASATRTPKEPYYWVRKDISTITSSDVFVIVNKLSDGSTYAMSNDNGSSSAPSAVAVPVTSAGDRLTENPAERLKWTLSEESNGYIFYPAGQTNNYLYNRNNNNSLRVGSLSLWDLWDLLFNGYSWHYTINNNYLYNSSNSRYVGIYIDDNTQDWRSYTSITGQSNIRNQSVAFYVRVDAASYYSYTETFQRDNTFTEQNTDYINGGWFVNTCDGLAIKLTNVNNSGSTIMYAGSRNSASVATITTKTAVPEALKSVTLSITRVNTSLVNSIKLYVSPTSDFSAAAEYTFNIMTTGTNPATASGAALATITAPAANMYYKIAIDLKNGSNGHFRFDRIIYATE